MYCGSKNEYAEDRIGLGENICEETYALLECIKTTLDAKYESGDARISTDSKQFFMENIKKLLTTPFLCCK